MHIIPQKWAIKQLFALMAFHHLPFSRQILMRNPGRIISFYYLNIIIILFFRVMSLAKKVFIDPISVFLPVKMLEQEEFALLIAILSSNPSKNILNLFFFDSKLMSTSLKYRP
jgi:hypothetical protein